jgi:two-component system, NtrC family, sensor kinase
MLVLATFTAVSGYALVRLDLLREQLHVVNQGYLHLALHLNELERLQAQISQQAQDFLDGKAPPGRSFAEATRLARVRRQGDIRRAVDMAQRAGVSDLAGELGLLARAFLDADALYLVNDPPTVERLARRELTRFSHAVRKLKIDARERAFELARAAEEEEVRQLWRTLALVLVAVAVAAAVTFAAHATLRPLVRLTAHVRRVGRGELPLATSFATTVGAAAGRRGPADEIGDLAAAFDQMAAALDERERRLVASERLATVGRIAAQITHEVRNPLSSIALNAELLEEELGAAANPEAQRLLRAIGAEVDRLTEITEEYLRFARMPRGKLEPEDLAQIARGVVDFMAGELGRRGVELRVDLGAAPALVDENQLRQALVNLLRNALEATPAGGLVRVRTGGVPGDDTLVEVAVTDSGPGVSAEARARLFEPFFTTKQGGTGLGLALVQQIAAGHGGTVGVATAPGAGACFSVRLPRRAPGGPGATLTSAPSAAASASTPPPSGANVSDHGQ